jgi:orotidine-5'-phosphate decarboxylase
MGYDSLEPFLKHIDKINFILALTSNQGAIDFEKLELKEGTYLYQKVISKVNLWNSSNNCGIVFGATKLEELRANIENFGDLYVLLPGVGAQGGNLEEVICTFTEKKFINYIINISRYLIYIDHTREFGKKVNEEIKRINSLVHNILNK